MILVQCSSMPCVTHKTLTHDYMIRDQGRRFWQDVKGDRHRTFWAMSTPISWRHTSSPSHKFCRWYWQSKTVWKLKIRISKSEIRNNIKIPIFKIQNKSGTRPWFFCFDHSCFEHLNLFRVSIFEFRISVSLPSGSNAKHHPTFQLAILGCRTFETRY